MSSVHEMDCLGEETVPVSGSSGAQSSVASDLRVVCVTSPAASFPPVGNGRNGPALLCL